MKRILITGANSYIGVSMERWLNKQSDSYEVVTIDMIDGSWMAHDFSAYDVVFHVAGIAHIKETAENAEQYYKINRDLAVDVANKAKNAKVGQFIFMSSMSVYGQNEGVITVNTPANPSTHYGKSKLQAEEILNTLQDDLFKVAILRPPMVYGYGCRGNYQKLKSMALKLPLFPYVNNKRSMIYIGNLCEFIRLIVDHGDGGVFFPQNADYVCTHEMVKHIAAVQRKRIRVIRGFGWCINLAKKAFTQISKAFGSLTYEMSMSTYKENYCVFDFENSIVRTESGNEKGIDIN